MNKTILAALATLTGFPLVALDASPADASPPGWRHHHRYRPYHYGPVMRPRRAPVVYYPAPAPVVYVPAPAPVVYIPPPRRMVVVEPEHVTYAPAPAETVQQAPPARARPGSRDFLAVGVHVLGGAAEGLTVGLSTAENPAMGGLGVHLRGRFSDDFGLELSADFLSGSADSGDLTQNTIPVMAALTWHILPTSRFQPYLLAGAGVHFTRLEYFGGDYNIDITELAGQLGGGLEVFITKNLALHADIRAQTVFKSLDTQEKINKDCVAQVGNMTGFCDNIPATSASDKVDIGFSFQAGASWYF